MAIDLNEDKLALARELAEETGLRADAFDPLTLLTSFIGAVVLLAIVNFIQRGRAR